MCVLEYNRCRHQYGTERYLMYRQHVYITPRNGGVTLG